jgi:hypothetical protein
VNWAVVKWLNRKSNSVKLFTVDVTLVNAGRPGRPCEFEFKFKFDPSAANPSGLIRHRETNC